MPASVSTNRPGAVRRWPVPAALLLTLAGAFPASGAEPAVENRPAEQALPAPVFQWKNPSGTRLFGNAVVLPEEGGPRPGGLAPQLELPDQNNTLFTSRSELGLAPLAMLFLGEGKEVKLGPQVASAARTAQAVGWQVLALGNLAQEAPAPIRTLKDTRGALGNYAPSPLLVAVDKAGWIRSVESIPKTETDPENTYLQFLLKNLGDITPPLAVGRPAPDFSFRDARGVWRSPSALRGRKNLVLTFFPKCFTGRCKTHLSALRDSFPAFLGAGTEVWAVSVDAAGGEKGQVAFSDSLNLQFPLLPDTGRNISLLYGAAVTPEDLSRRQTILIDRQGVVRWLDQDINPETHALDLLAKMKELQMLP